ncbi:hypothetical protein ScPMuIL_015524 [Solemya velum]
MAAEADEKPCTIEELTNIITAQTGGFTLLPSEDFDEVYPNIYIGDESIARDRVELKRLGMTHILNSALGKDNFHVNTNHVMYRKVGMEFLGLESDDMRFFQLHPFFNKAADFIEKCLSSGGKVLVHCVQGVSRSATLVIAYLMIKCHMTVQDALRLVRSRREICPNDGFLQQLCHLNEELRKKGHFDKVPSQTDNQTGSTTEQGL